MEQTNFPQSDQSYHPKHHIKVYVWIGLVVASLGVAVNGYFYFLNLEQGATPVACTMEAKLCPDGTAVGRTGPNCEFAECPGQLDTSTWKTYRNEEYGFEFNIPADWAVAEEKSIGKFLFRLEISKDEESFEVRIFNGSIDEIKPDRPRPAGYTIGTIPAYMSSGAACQLSPCGYINWYYIQKNNLVFEFVTISRSEYFSVGPDLSTFRFIDNKNTGTLSGKISIGPNCPVEREGVVCIPSPEAYASREFIVSDSSQKEVTRFHADANGSYTIMLAPGTYTVVSAQTGMGYMSKDLPNTINIKAGQSTILNINIDTGIR